MLNLIKILGRLSYIFGYPLVYLVLNGSRRSRVIIECNGQVLLVRHTMSMGRWGFPGGGAHKGEPLVAAAKREVYEELGIDLASNKMELVATEFEKVDLAKVNLNFYYVSLNKKPDIRIQILEILDYRWVKPDDMSEYKIDRVELKVHHDTFSRRAKML